MKPLTIGQVATAAGVTADTVRFYERAGLLAEPGRTPARYRQYDEDAVARLRFILRAKEFGFTLREIKGLIGLYESLTATRGVVRAVADARIAAIEAQIAELRAAEDALIRVRALCGGDGPASGCPILQVIAGVCHAHPQDRPAEGGG